MSYCDAHIHLQKMPFPQQTIEDAHRVGVVRFFCNATNEADWQSVLSLTENPNVVGCVGVHPWFLDTIQPDWNKRLEALLKNNPLLMVGEIGIDKTLPDISKQESIFLIQLRLAQKYNRPMHIHCVHAWDRVISLLRDNPHPVFISHAHKSGISEIGTLAHMGGYFSFSKPVKYVKDIPLSRLLVESDAPNGLSDPCKIPQLINQIAMLYGKVNIEQSIYQNVKEFMHGRKI